jgi:hypothetical protein
MPRDQNKGSGMGGGAGRGAGRSGLRGGMGGKNRGGPGGNCVCPKCSEKVVHQQGVPCYSVNCPKCGAVMTRE